MLVKVLQAHINNGIPKAPRSCPIAIAMSDNGFYSAYVGRKTITTSFSGKPIGKLPWKARRFIRRFDAGKPVQPIEFELKRE